jgi:LacI family transcriptional regulator, xylobiose transport system transcriptional regulator
LVNKSLETISRNLMYKEVAERIRKLIDEKGLWGRFLAPERELAETFGVSRDTVRKGLDELKEEGLITRRQGFGTQVRPREGDDIGIVTGRLIVGTSGGYPGEFIRGIAEICGQEQWLSYYCDLMSPAGRAEYLEKLSNREYQGAVLISVCDDRTVEQVLSAWPGALVVIDHHFPDQPVTCIMEDCSTGLRQAVAHLLELGHKRIGFVAHSRRELNPWKEDGYRQAMDAAGVYDQALIARAEATYESGQRGGEELLALSDPPTAIIASSDRQAWGVWRAAELAGRTVGKDFALVGYGDESAAAGLNQVLTSVSFDISELGRQAVRKVISLARGRGESGELVLTPTALSVRDSSKNARVPVVD